MYRCGLDTLVSRANFVLVREIVANIPDTKAAMPKRGPAHPGLSSIDPFGALVVICCTIIFAAWLFHDTPVQHVVAAVVAFYAVFALAVAILCRNSKVSQS